MTQNNVQTADSTSAFERPMASISSTCTWLHGIFLDSSKATTLLMVPAMNRTIKDVARTEDSQESQPEIALREHVSDLPSSAATEVPARSVYDRSSGDIEPAPMRANRRDVTLVDTHHSEETGARFGANAVVAVRGKGRKLCESFTANEWREQYQVLCIALFNHSRQSRADRDEDEGLRDAA